MDEKDSLWATTSRSCVLGQEKAPAGLIGSLGLEEASSGRWTGVNRIRQAGKFLLNEGLEFAQVWR